MSNSPLVIVKNISKINKYDSIIANVSFELKRGEIFGLFGGEGSGKSLILEGLLGLQIFENGDISVMGLNPRGNIGKLKNFIGVMFQSFNLPGNICVGEALELFCAYHDVSPRYDLLKRLDLEDDFYCQYCNLEVYKQRQLAFILTVAHNPMIVIFDEPLAVIPNAHKEEMYKIISELKSIGTSIIIATRDFSVAENLVIDETAILSKGEIIAKYSFQEIKAMGRGIYKLSLESSKSTLLNFSTNTPAIIASFAKDNQRIFYTSKPENVIPILLSYLSENKDKLIQMRLELPSLEERIFGIRGGIGE